MNLCLLDIPFDPCDSPQIAAGLRGLWAIHAGKLHFKMRWGEGVLLLTALLITLQFVRFYCNSII